MRTREEGGGFAGEHVFQVGVWEDGAVDQEGVKDASGQEEECGQEGVGVGGEEDGEG